MSAGALSVMPDSDFQLPWFSSISLEGEVASQYIVEGSQYNPKELELKFMAPITIFVGANNSGKSRLLRELFRAPQATRIALASSQTNGFAQFIKQILPGPHNRDNWALAAHFQNDAVAEHLMKSDENWISQYDLEFIGNLRQLQINAIGAVEDQRRQLTSTDIVAHRQLDQKHSLLSKWQSEVTSILEASGLLKRLSGWSGPKRCYIPILRGMRPLVTQSGRSKDSPCTHDYYSERTIDDYFSDLASEDSTNSNGRPGNNKRFIFTGLTLYSDIQKRLLSADPVERQSIVDYQLFLSKYFFGGQSVLLVPALLSKDGSHNDVIYIRIGNDEERRIYELGDGMQSLIISTFPIVTETRPGSLFFLEEPDLCMHPSLQRSLMDALREYHRKMGHQFFLTTHSNHLLDLVEDAEVASVNCFSEVDKASMETLLMQSDADSLSSASCMSIPRFRIRCARMKDRNVLSQLGVRPSATFLANATIWVEGVSDAAYVRVFMESYLHYLRERGGVEWSDIVVRLGQYREDSHYAFIEYNGSNLEHFEFDDHKNDRALEASASSRSTTFAPSLCAEAIVIADGDIASKDDRLATFRSQLGDRLVVLPGKEIENLIPEEIVKIQVQYDHSPPKIGEVTADKIESISYLRYARCESGASDHIGLGRYLGEELKIDKYSGSSSGTLPDRYKRRWRSDDQGIPAKIRKALNTALPAESPKLQGDELADLKLPSFLNQDIIWLCTCIFAHIAKCNYDKDAEAMLRGFQSFILDQQPRHEELECCRWPATEPNADFLLNKCLLSGFRAAAVNQADA